MSDSRDSTKENVHSDEEHREEAVLKYNDASNIIKNAEENIVVRNKCLYGTRQIDQEFDIGVEDVLSQIVQDVTVMESSQFCISQSRKVSKNDVTQSEFLSLNDIEYKHLNNFESQWDCNTQLAEIADNADALATMINCSNMQTKHIDSVVDIDLKSTDGNELGDIFNDDVFNDGSQSNKELKAEFENEQWTQNKCVKLDSDNLMHNEMHIMNEDVGLKTMGAPEMDVQPSSPILTQAIKKKKRRVAIIYKNRNLDEPLSKKAKIKDNIEIINSLENDLSQFANIDPTSVEDAFEGFTTASNKKIKVSEEEVFKAKAIFDMDIANETLSGFKIDISKEELDLQNEFLLSGEENKAILSCSKTTKNKLLNKAEDIIIEDIENEPFVTLNIDSNKQIEVSEEKINKAKPLFDDDMDVMEVCDKKLEESEAEFKTPLDKSKNVVINDDPSFSGFKTASNKEIQVSEEPLNTARNMFIEDITTESFIGFKTASNKKIEVSEEEVIKAKAIFDIDIANETLSGFKIDVSKEEFDFQNEFLLSGFKLSVEENKAILSCSKTAKNKLLNKAEDIIIEGIENEPFVTLSIDRNKQIEVSEEELNKAKLSFDDDMDVMEVCDKKLEESDVEFKTPLDKSKNVVINDDPSFSGFKTASNKEIQVSEEPLNTARNMFIEDIATGSFIGFKTASNKKIEVSEEEVIKAKAIFDIDIANETLSGFKIDVSKEELDLQNEFLLSGFKLSSEENKAILSCSKTAKNKLLNKAEDIIIENETFVTLSIDSNKQIEVSEEELNKAKLLLDDDMDVMEVCDKKLEESEAEFNTRKALDNSKNVVINDDPSFSGFKTASNKEIQVSEEALYKARNMFIEDIADEPYIGFKTASNKKIEVSEEELNKAKLLFDDNMEMMEVSNKKLEESEADLNIFIEFKTQKLSQENLSKSKNVDIDDDPSFSGFRTATNKEIQVSEEALIKARNIFIEDIADEPFIGFKTANNKKIEVSEEELHKAKLMFDEDLDVKNEKLEESEADLEAEFMEFKTPNNEKIVSHEDPNKTKCIFDLKDMDINNDPSFSGFKTASNKAIVVSEDALNKAKDMFVEAVKIEPFVGLKTANNKKIEVSEEELNKAKLFFDDDMDFMPVNDRVLEVSEVSELKLSNNENIEVSQEDLSEVRRMVDLKDMDLNNAFSFSGFKTASYKEIEVSEEALNRAKNMFNEDVAVEPFIGFKTASNKKIEVPENELNKAKLMFIDNMEVSNEGLEVSEAEFNDFEFGSFSGFKTASNKEIEVSEDVLNKAKDMFVENVPVESFIGFKMASDKKIEVSEEELNKAKLMYDDNTDVIEVNDRGLEVSEEEFNDFESQFIDFKIPNIEKMEASQEVIEKANLMFDLKDMDINNGFKTASNKEIEVSEETLNKAKNMFIEEVENELLFKEELNKAKLLFEDDMDLMEVNDKKPEKTEVVSQEGLGESILMFDLKDVDIKDDLKTASNEEIEATEALNKAKDVEIELFDGFNKKIDVSVEDLKLASNDETDLCSSKTLTFRENVSEESIDAKKSDVHTKLSYEAVKDCCNKKADDPVNEEISESIKAFLVDESLTIFNENDYKSPIKNVEDPKSPILQIKSKKRKFKNQYAPEVKKIRLSNNSEKMTLKQLYDIKKSDCHNDCLIDEDVVEVTPQNAVDFIFKGKRCDLIKTDCFKSVDLIEIFVNQDGVDKKIIPDGWVLNHLKWIIWKLASYERCFKKMASNLLIVSNVLKQLKYRYDRELHNTQRPILRKILEKDDVPNKRMVLCVSNIVPVESNLEADNENERLPVKLQKAKYEIELTDGWYAVMTVLDSLLSMAIENGKIVVGTKLMIYGAELLNCNEGVSPLEDLNLVRLKIWANSCRRCSAWLKLGLYKISGPLPLKLENCKAGGGPLPKLRIVPLTIYPTFYLNKSSDGSIAMRSEKLQQIHSMKVEAEFQAKIESLYAEVEQEFNQDKAKLKNYGKLRKPTTDDSPEDLADMLESAADPNEFLNSVTESQRLAIERYVVKKKIAMNQDVEKRVRSLMEERGLVKEKPVKVLKARIATSYKGELSFAILTIWRIDDYVIEAIKEGVCFDVTNLTPTGIMKGDYHLSGGKRSVFIEVPKNKFPDLDLYKRSCLSFERFYEPDFIPKFYEVDVVGLVVAIEPKNLDNLAKYQTVYIVNESMVFLALIFWGGLNKIGYDKVILEGSFLACQNLQFRYTTSPKNIFHLHSSEYSTYTSNPRKSYLKSALNDLEDHLKGINFHKYLSECSESLRTILNSPKRYASRSAFGFKKDGEDHSLSGLDFDSTFVDSSDIFKPDNSKLPSNFYYSKINISSILSESNTILSSPVQKKIDKLKIYGEPPPMSPLMPKNSKRVNKSFTIPIMNKSTEADAENKPTE